MARLVVVSGAEKGREFELGNSQTIGRLSSNNIALKDTRLSRQHTRISLQGDSWWVEDLESKNGTFLNGVRIDRSRLEDNEEIRIGETYFVFLADASPESSAPLVDSRLNPDDVYARQTATSKQGADSVELGTTSKKQLSFSRFADRERNTMTSFVWLRQDLQQRHVGFKALIVLGVILVAGGLFWLVQMMIGGE